MMSGQLSNQVLFELSQLQEQPVVDWRAEWNRLYGHYLQLENKIEALTEDVGDLENEKPVDFVAIVKELKELSGDSVKFEYWDMEATGNKEFTLWSSKRSQHYNGKTFAEAEENFRAVFAQVGSFAEADAKEKSQ